MTIRPEIKPGSCNRCKQCKESQWFRMQQPWGTLCRECHEQVRAALEMIHSDLLKLDEDGLKEVAAVISRRILMVGRG